MTPIQNELCQCPPGECLHFVEPASACINRVARARTAHCETCHPGGTGHTWHQDGACLRCGDSA